MINNIRARNFSTLIGHLQEQPVLSEIFSIGYISFNIDCNKDDQLRSKKYRAARLLNHLKKKLEILDGNFILTVTLTG
jgi:hypothetical protein